MKKEIDKIIKQLDTCIGMFDYVLSPTENMLLVTYIRDLEENLDDYDRLFDTWNKRKLIKKFNKEFSKQYVKEEKKKGRKVAGAIPDAEYVYEKYYELKKKCDKIRKYCNLYTRLSAKDILEMLDND